MLAAPTRSRVSPQVAQLELARRKLARQKLLHFCRYMDPKFEFADHLQLVAEKLEQVERFVETRGAEGIGRLMILMPPQHGKSELASRKFPAHILGRLPHLRIILLSYGADLASKNSRFVRDAIETKSYQALFGGLSSRNEPVELSSDSRGIASWDLAQPHRGGMIAAGVGGGITGQPADLIIADDLFKNREEADSKDRRDLVDDWWKSSVLTRQRGEHAAIILFFTHWHADDQVGRLMKRMVEDPKADQWDILMLPALALDSYMPSVEEQRKKMREGVFIPLTDPLGRRPGEPLWPARFGRAFLDNRKANLGLYEFTALDQQMPFLREGGQFKREWFQVVESGPGKEAVARVMYWDKAATEGGGARTAGAVLSLDKDGFFNLEHMVKGQWSTYRREKKMVQAGKIFYGVYGKFQIWHPQDPGSAGVDSAKATNGKLAINGLVGHYAPVTGDKETRAGPLSSAAEAGIVRLVRGGWNEEFIDEAVAFPGGAFKDQIDAASDAYNKLLEIVDKKRESRIL